MQTEPWNSDLLDFLGSDFAIHGYDLKHTLRSIANSQAYQSRCEVLSNATTGDYQYAGPRAKRMTAEQFLDTLWQLTGTAPTEMHAKFLRGKLDPKMTKSLSTSAQWIWSSNGRPSAAAGEKRSFRKRFDLSNDVLRGGAVATCDNKFTLYLDGKEIAKGENWQVPTLISLGPLKQGAHELLIVGENLGDAPNPAGLFFEARLGEGETAIALVTDTSWQWSAKLPKKGKFANEPSDWQSAVALANQGTWAAVQDDLRTGLARASYTPTLMVRAALRKADPMMRALGRPNRDQIVSMRPNELSTLEAINLANGAAVAQILSDGSVNLMKRQWQSPAEFVDWLYIQSLAREPSIQEQQIAGELLGNEEVLTARGVEDLLWAVVMLPEFQIVR
jgi:hypothetical protein